MLENALGAQCGLGLEELLASARGALNNTNAPHIVIYAVDTDDTGEIDWPRFRSGLLASLLMDHTYFAFDFGSRDHGGVTGYWFHEYYDAALGAPLAHYTFENGVYRRDFEKGLVVVAVNAPAALSLGVPHTDLATGESGMDFTVPEGDARIFVREGK